MNSRGFPFWWRLHVVSGETRRPLCESRGALDATQEEPMADPDLGAVLDEHLRSEFEPRDLEATMATMSPEPYLYHVPTQTGGAGYEEVKRFYAEDFIPAWPDDTEVTPIS